MNHLDSGEEERRLREQYAQMNEDELQAVADYGYELTEIARSMLQSEISQRGLKIKLKDAPPPAAAPETLDESDDPLDSPLVTVREASDLPEAHRLQDILDAAGVPYCWGPDNLENVDAFNSNLDDGLALKVCTVDLDRAVRALNLALPPEPEDAEEEDYVAVCPKCHSSEIVFQGRDAEPTTGSTNDSKFNWSCDACGHQWKDDGIEEEA